MITDRWYAILESRALGRRPVGLTRFGRELVAWRDGDGRAVVMPARCPHRGANLALGRVLDGTLECPYHGFRYDAQGRCVRTPCEGMDAPIPPGLVTTPSTIRESDGLVWMWWGAPSAELPEVPWFDELRAMSGCRASHSYTWPVTYERVMESLLDFHHVPFAHRRWTMGGGTRLEHTVEREGDVIRVEGQLRKEHRERGVSARMTVRFPGTILIDVTPRLRAGIACCPIDEERAWFTIRYYQEYVRVPLLRTAASWLLMQYERLLIQPTDRGLLLGARPRHPTRKSFNLVHADKTIALWLKLWEEAAARQVGEDTHPAAATARRTQPAA